MLELGAVVVVQVVQAHDLVTARQQDLADMHADKAGGAGDKNFHDEFLSWTSELCTHAIVQQPAHAPGPTSPSDERAPVSVGRYRLSFVPNASIAWFASRVLLLIASSNPLHAGVRPRQSKHTPAVGQAWLSSPH